MSDILVMNRHFILALRNVLCIVLLCIAGRAQASHILGGDLTYAHVSGLTYKITLVLYGDCSTSGMSILSTATPQICIYEGPTSAATLALSFVSSAEVTPLCVGDTSTCVDPLSTTSGVKRFVYSYTYTLPHTSSVWRFIFDGNLGVAGAAGRATPITNILSGTYLNLTDTLNNISVNNTSPTLNEIEPLRFYVGSYSVYNPMPYEPDGDSLLFSLTNALNGTASCGGTSPSVVYTGTAWPGQPISGATPLMVDPTRFYLYPNNGMLEFVPTAMQRGIILYNVREFRGGVFVGSSQREMTVSVGIGAGRVCSGTPTAGSITPGTACSGYMYTLNLTGYSCGVTFQWQKSADSVTWSNITGATSDAYSFSATLPTYYRCKVTCVTSGLSDVTGGVFLRGRTSSSGLNCVIINNHDSVCNPPQFYVTTCLVSALQKVVTYYGDGLSDTNSLSPTYISSALFSHNYPSSGTYRIKQILLVGGVPVDSFETSFEYHSCRFLPIKLYYDLDSNCSFGSLDRQMLFPMLIKIDSNGIALDTVSVTSGYYYKALGPVGTIYTFTVLYCPPGIYVSCPTSGGVSDTIQPYLTGYPIKYLAFRTRPGALADLSITPTVSTTARIKQKGYFYIGNTGLGVTVADAQLTFSPKYVYTPGIGRCIPDPTSVTGNVLNWSLGAGYGYTPVSYYLDYNTTIGMLTLGDTTHSAYQVTSLTGDIDLTNNSAARIDTVRTSFDPNQISVSPTGVITSGTQLTYTIEFENTGNDTAHDIHIMDTLSDYVDVRSLELKMATAAMNIATYRDGGHNIVKFDFPHIMLPDSSHRPYCHGMVIYKINTLAGLPDGTIIPNRAGIYFDDNDVVMTNTVENVIGRYLPLAAATTGNAGADLYPNPVNDYLTINTVANQYATFTITNAVGQTLMRQELTGAIHKADVRALPAGVYYLALRGSGATVVKRFVKL